MQTTSTTKTKDAPPDAVARPKCIPALLPEEKPREFGRGEVVYGRESDRGDEQRGEVVREVCRENGSHRGVAMWVL
jgi:hypothetical protein